MFVALKYGKVALYDYWVLSSFNSWDQGYSLIWNGAKTHEYYVFKQYARFVRPGMVQMRSGSSDDSVPVLAFRGAADQTLAVVLLNTSHAQKSVGLLGAALPSQVRLYRSNSSDNCVDGGLVSTSAVTLPALSIVTLTASNYNPAVSVVDRRELRMMVSPDRTTGSVNALCDLAGRSWRAGQAPPAGLVYLVRPSAGGSALRVVNLADWSLSH
jgi:hypothetical protein